MLRSWVRGGAAAVVVFGLAAGGLRAETPTVSSEAASALTDSLDIGLRQWLPSTGAKAGWHWAGRPLVTPAGDHFDVDLPALTITDDDGSGIQAGVIKLTLAPAADGSWQVGITVPGQIPMIAADARPTARSPSAPSISRAAGCPPSAPSSPSTAPSAASAPPPRRTPPGSKWATSPSAPISPSSRPAAGRGRVRSG